MASYGIHGTDLHIVNEALSLLQVAPLSQADWEGVADPNNRAAAINAPIGADLARGLFTDIVSQCLTDEPWDFATRVRPPAMVLRATDHAPVDPFVDEGLPGYERKYALAGDCGLVLDVYVGQESLIDRHHGEQLLAAKQGWTRKVKRAYDVFGNKSLYGPEGITGCKYISTDISREAILGWLPSFKEAVVFKLAAAMAVTLNNTRTDAEYYRGLSILRLKVAKEQDAKQAGTTQFYG